MCSMSVLCPLCAVPSFDSIDALQQRLIKAANGPLPCPFIECQQLFLGLDKLTIHLFTHTSLMTKATPTIAEQQGHVTSSDGNQTANNTKNDKKITTQSDPVKAAVQIRQSSDTVQKPLPLQELTPKRKTKRVKTNKGAATVTKTASQNTFNNTALLNSNTTTTSMVNMPNNSRIVTTAPVTCDICEFSFRNLELRNMHFRLVHENVIEPMNNNNNINNNNNNFKQELNSNNNKSSQEPYKCHLCKKTFKIKGSLRVHLKVVHLMGLPYVNNMPKLNICDRIRYKEATTTNGNTLATTTTNAVAQQQQQPSSYIQQQQQQNVNNTTAQTACVGNAASTIIKQLTPTSVLNINGHGELVTSTTDSNKNNTNILLVFNNNNNNNNNNITAPSPEPDNKDNGRIQADTNPKIWECDACGKSFTTKYFLKKHKRLHTGEMPYTCEICARTFTFQQSYHKHLLYHSEIKPHVCAICGRAFKELSTLHNHERIHSGEKPFKCEVCGKCFRQRVSFLVHTRIHTGVMPYRCEICAKSFRYKVSQRTHKCVQQQALTYDEATSSGSQLTYQETSTESLSDSFIKAFLENNAAASTTLLNETQHSPASAEIAAITDADQARLTKAIDDIVVESCQKLGIGLDNDCQPAAALPPVVSMCHETSTSPLDKMQNLRLYSPPQDDDAIDATGGDHFERFLLDASNVHLI